MEIPDFTNYRAWMKANDATGTVFVPGDAESAYEEERLQQPYLPPWEKVREDVLHSGMWVKVIPDHLAEIGNEMVYEMISDFIADIHRRRGPNG